MYINQSPYLLFILKARGMARGGRFQELADHSLRLSDVTPIKERANLFSRRLLIDSKYGKPLIMADSSLGDPTKFGLKQPLRLKEALLKVIENDPSYTQSIGYPDLRDELRHRNLHIIGEGTGEQVVSTRLNEKDAFIYTGAGSSGVVRAYMGAVAGGKKHRAIVFVPELTYPLFLAEAAYVEADVVTIPLNPKTGLVDPDHLRSIMEDTIEEHGKQVRYVFVNTTIGNPLGSAMDVGTFNAVTHILNSLNQKHDIRIHRITDPTYERFRRDQTQTFDPVEQILKEGSTSVELVTGTFSKSECWPGKRLGYGILLADKSRFRDFDLEEFKELIFRHMDVSHAITLGIPDIHNQMAVAVWLNEQRTNPTALHEEIQRQAAMRTLVNANVLSFAQALIQIDGVKAHPFCLTESGDIDPNKLNSFYLMWRFRYGRDGKSQAARLAEWTFVRAVTEIQGDGVQTTPIIFHSDGDMFYAKYFRGHVPQYIRTVALHSPEAAQSTLNLISDFAHIVRMTGRPPEYMEAFYPF
ncbi:Histidinol-phosphate aminotransferase [Candidatus Bilamarchaeum dharawalense]|uniref:Histidinol-phosphate aminotransferase n=1 Tax=Candidatus Bilamarchaeum dharawalense TaxID=2885759 RepID=A0A5E4LTL6_9ARCH|nr:Histidinol-phosphate aminotransferase [Candidatus Bilamarchaeum dharawalense]